MLFERLRKSRRRLVTDPRRDLWDGVVARFEHSRGLVHPSRHEVTIYRLADKPGEASREGRAAKPHMASQLPKSPRSPRMFVDQLKRLAYVPIRDCAEPATFARTKGFYPTAHTSTKSTSVIRESTASWPGR